MPLKRLVLGNFRNIEHAELLPSELLNFIWGDNGSGKTSVLEALSTLSLGRSFRTRKFKNIVQYEKAEFTLFGQVEKGAQKIGIGVARRQDGKSLFKVDGRPISSSVELATLLPMQVINAQSFELFEGGPAQRRRFLDWIVFHVKHSFRSAWGAYARCLKQRNSLLRRDKIAPPDLLPWTVELARLGEQLDRLRQEVVCDFLPILQEYLEDCTFLRTGRFDIQYIPGWDTGSALLQQYENSYARDRKLGHTTLGPHKSDLKLTFNRKPVVELFSRGQQKSIITALYVAQLKAFQSDSRDECILLIDDLPSELDAHNLILLSRWLSDLDRVQTFITGIDLKDLIALWPRPQIKKSKVFHVKHGQVSEQPCEWSDQ